MTAWSAYTFGRLLLRLSYRSSDLLPPQYSEQAANDLFASSNLQPVHRWTSTNGMYSLWLLCRPLFVFPVQLAPPHAIMNEPPAVYTFPNSNRVEPPFPTIPTLDEWKNQWALWDMVTLGMIPPAMLHQKPIHLRHKCLFYLGHIPAYAVDLFVYRSSSDARLSFLDIHLSRLLDEPHTEPEYFKVLWVGWTCAKSDESDRISSSAGLTLMSTIQPNATYVRSFSVTSSVLTG